MPVPGRLIPFTALNPKRAALSGLKLTFSVGGRPYALELARIFSTSDQRIADVADLDYGNVVVISKSKDVSAANPKAERSKPQ
jgi:hypothetical protein